MPLDLLAPVPDTPNTVLKSLDRLRDVNTAQQNGKIELNIFVSRRTGESGKGR